MSIVKEGFVLFLVDTHGQTGADPRPYAAGYFSTRPFVFQGKKFPRCCPLLTAAAKVYTSYNYAYSAGEGWKKKCEYVSFFKIEMVGVTDTGGLVLLDNVVEQEMRSRTPYIPEAHKDHGLILPSDTVGEKGIPYTFPNGENTLLYTRNHLAVQLGRGTKTIRQWEISKVIPESGFRGKQGEVLYSKEQISVVTKAAERARLSVGRPMKNTHFSKWVYKGFEKLKEHHEREMEE